MPDSRPDIYWVAFSQEMVDASSQWRPVTELADSFKLEIRDWNIAEMLLRHEDHDA